MNTGSDHSDVVTKRKVTNLSAVTIICRRSDPSQICIEMKDKGHPLKMVHGRLCIMGGNWIGAGAKNDRGPLDTARRELLEELSLDRPPRDFTELADLNFSKDMSGVEARAAATKVPPTNEDRALLRQINQKIVDSLEPYGDFLLSIGSEAILAADPESKKGPFSSVSSCFIAALDDETWKALGALHQKYGSLSSDALSIMTSLEEILEKDIGGAFGYEQVLAHFWLSMGYAQGNAIPFLNGITVEPMGTSMGTYDKYLDRYEIERRP